MSVGNTLRPDCEKCSRGRGCAIHVKNDRIISGCEPRGNRHVHLIEARVARSDTYVGRKGCCAPDCHRGTRENSIRRRRNQTWHGPRPSSTKTNGIERENIASSCGTERQSWDQTGRSDVVAMHCVHRDNCVLSIGVLHPIEEFRACPSNRHLQYWGSNFVRGTAVSNYTYLHRCGWRERRGNRVDLRRGNVQLRIPQR